MYSCALQIIGYVQSTKSSNCQNYLYQNNIQLSNH